MKSRSKSNTKADEVQPETEKRQLPANDANPPRLLLLNRRIGNDAAIMTLAHPRTLQPTRYYVCPASGIYEFQKLTTSAPANCSWLLETTPSGSEPETSTGGPERQGEHGATDNGYVSKAPDVYAATPFDPMFLLLPALETQSACKGEQRKRHFLCPDDLFEQLFETSKHFQALTNTPLQKVLEQRLAAICDIVDTAGMKMYRLNDDKLLKELLSKARKISATELPASMEDRFVIRPLEMPVSVNTLVTSPTLEPKDSSTCSQTDESQATTISSTFDSQASVATDLTIPEADIMPSGESANVKDLQRLRTAFSFILSAYVPPNLATFLMGRIDDVDSGVDFAPLDTYLKEIARMKAEALEATSIGNFSRKRGLDDEEVAERAEKRKKKEEEEKKRKANESRGVRDLKKVNVTGMKKMSDFFKKMPVK